MPQESCSVADITKAFRSLREAVEKGCASICHQLWTLACFFLDYAHKLRFGPSCKKYQVHQQVTVNFAHSKQQSNGSGVENMKTESAKAIENWLRHVSGIKNS